MPVKLCECGCGQPAPIAKMNRRKRGQVKGQPIRFIFGHSGSRRPNTPEEFWANIERKGPDDCWPWCGRRMSNGYGQFSYASKSWNAGRLAFVLTTGQSAAGLDVCHTCDNRACCNPAHLFLGTRAENLQDMRDKGRDVIPLGTHNGRAKLNPSLVRLIRKLANDGISGRAIGRKIGVDNKTVRQVIAGKIWKHVTE